MVQHVFIVPGLDGKPAAQPYLLNIWRDDQTITWKINMPGIGWNNNGPNGPNAAIVLSAQNSPPWEGSTPAPVGMMPIGLDTRLYTAAGPGANNGEQNVMFNYDMYVVDADGHEMRVNSHLTEDVAEVIDPEIGNQPQP